MIGTKERKNQKGDTTVPVKNRNSDSKFSHNSCGGCNACHQMTRIRSVTGNPTWDGSGGSSQKPCATNFFQRNLGNSYIQSIAAGRQTSGGVPTIQRKCLCGGSCVSCAGKEDEELRIQPKLTIGPVNDVYEQEADRVADQAMRMPDPFVETENGQFHKGFDIQRIAQDGGTKGSTADIRLDRSGGRPLSPSTRKFMEQRFGVDFGHVLMHRNQQAHETASQIKAKAFTYGNHVWLGRGQSEENKNLMAHELTHVLQQDGGVLKSVQRRCGEATPPAENENTIRNEIVNQARSQINEHYLWSAEGERPGLGDVIMDSTYQGVARVSGGCVCSGRHTQPDVMALPRLEQTISGDISPYCFTSSFLRTEGAGNCGGGCGSAAGTDIWGECCIGHRHFDCSGLVYWSYNQAGYNISRRTVAGYQGCDRNINQADLQSGDLCYIGNNHVGIYAGGNQVVEARAHNFGVVLTNFAGRGWTSFGSLF